MHEAEPINAAVVTASDTRTAENDTAGDALAELLEGLGANVAERHIVKDDYEVLRQTISALSLAEGLDLILTTGGTGLSARDNTPEATRSVIEKQAPGITEAIRAGTLTKTPFAMISRGTAGVANQTLIINLPGSEKAVRECFEIIRPVLLHAVEIVSGRKCAH